MCSSHWSIPGHWLAVLIAAYHHSLYPHQWWQHRANYSFHRIFCHMDSIKWPWLSRWSPHRTGLDHRPSMSISIHRTSPSISFRTALQWSLMTSEWIWHSIQVPSLSILTLKCSTEVWVCADDENEVVCSVVICDVFRIGCMNIIVEWMVCSISHEFKDRCWPWMIIDWLGRMHPVSLHHSHQVLFCDLSISIDQCWCVQWINWCGGRTLLFCRRDLRWWLLVDHFVRMRLISSWWWWHIVRPLLAKAKVISVFVWKIDHQHWLLLGKSLPPPSFSLSVSSSSEWWL